MNRETACPRIINARPFYGPFGCKAVRATHIKRFNIFFQSVDSVRVTRLRTHSHAPRRHAARSRTLDGRTLLYLSILTIRSDPSPTATLIICD